MGIVGSTDGEPGMSYVAAAMYPFHLSGISAGMCSFLVRGVAGTLSFVHTGLGRPSQGFSKHSVGVCPHSASLTAFAWWIIVSLLTAASVVFRPVAELMSENSERSTIS